MLSINGMSQCSILLVEARTIVAYRGVNTVIGFDRKRIAGFLECVRKKRRFVGSRERHYVEC